MFSGQDETIAAYIFSILCGTSTDCNSKKWKLSLIRQQRVKKNATYLLPEITTIPWRKEATKIHMADLPADIFCLMSYICIRMYMDIIIFASQM